MEAILIWSAILLVVANAGVYYRGMRSVAIFFFLGLRGFVWVNFSR